jgi:hypothetical protein
MPTTPLTFSAKVHKLGINPCVDVPEKVVGALLRAAEKEKGPVQVKGALNNADFAATLVKYSGAWRLYLNTQMRKDADVGVGDTVCISLSYDPIPRMPPTPQELRKALSDNEQAKQVWRLQPSSRRREILAYLNSLKTQESLEHNVQKAVKMLLDKRKLK